MLRRNAALIMLFLASAARAGAGTVAGKVTLVAEGKDRADGSNSVIWIEGAHAPAGAAKCAMKSASKRFDPRVIAVSKNATVEFPNADPIYHNVFSVSGANRFDLGLYRSGSSKSKTFDQPGLVRIYCNIHPQMVGFVMVVDSDFVAVTGPDGAFRFDNVPPGPHVVKAWNEEGSEISLPVTVKAGADDPLAIRIDVSGFKAEPHKNKYGKDYAPNDGASTDERY
jgi:plastocyanin